jgi:hypothetical protein
MGKLPQGLLDHIEAVERLAPNGGLAEKKDAWRRLCQAITKKRILATILNESGSSSYAADPDQFLALQERYFKVARSITGRLQHRLEKHDLTVENPDPLSEWRDKDGTTHFRSRVCIHEDDLWKVRKARAESHRGVSPSWIGASFVQSYLASWIIMAIFRTMTRSGIAKRGSKRG